MIRAVTVDLWNTLVDGSNGAARKEYRVGAVSEALARIGAPRGGEEIDGALQALYPLFEKSWREEQRTLTTAEMVAEIWRRMEVSMPGEAHRAVVRRFEESILHGPPRLVEGAGDALARLGSFAALGLVSDTAFSPGRVLTRLLEQWGIRRCFRALVYSDETGVSKPHRKAFETALTALGAAPAEAVHVGDIEWTDIRGAKELGMRALLFCGCRDSAYRGDPGGTAADAIAESWEEVVRIVESWREEERQGGGAQ